MAVYPRATVRNIPPGPNDPPITVIGAILHVASGTSRSLYDYFNGPSGGIEAHFYIRDDGTTEQYRDTKFEADANLHANSFQGKDGKLYGYISIETWGLDTGEWNPAMLDEIKRLLLWASATHHFPLHKCASPTDPGVGYHVMFGAPGPWTPVAKTCPGPNRIKQFDNILVPWMAHGDTTTTEDNEMLTPEAITQVRAAVQAELEEYGVRNEVAPTGTITGFMAEVRAQLKAIATDVAALKAKP